MPEPAKLLIRTAIASDADAISAALIASITQLCHADHQNDPEKIAAWTLNKTPENIRRWITDGQSKICVAELNHTIAGVAGYLQTGQILLNYVTPFHRFQGVSDQLLNWIERELTALGVSQGRLESTLTAERFYQSRGWRPSGPVTYAFGMPGQPMVKRLLP